MQVKGMFELQKTIEGTIYRYTGPNMKRTVAHYSGYTALRATHSHENRAAQPNTLST